MIIISPLTLYPTPSEAPLTYQLTLSIKKKMCAYTLSFTHTQNMCDPFLLHQTKTLVHMKRTVKHYQQKLVTARRDLGKTLGKIL